MSAILGPAAATVGLQVLLQPYGQAAQLGKAACACVGLIYPAYRTLQTVEACPHSAPAANKWLIYWSIYGLISAAERPLDKVLAWVPYWPLVKVVLLMWLQSSRYEGAQRLYVEGLRPFLATWQHSIDDFLASLMRSLRRPEMQMVAEGIHAVAASIPVLEWFTHDPSYLSEGRHPPRRAFITDGSSSDDQPGRR